MTPSTTILDTPMSPMSIAPMASPPSGKKYASCSGVRSSAPLAVSTRVVVGAGTTVVDDWSGVAVVGTTVVSPDWLAWASSSSNSFSSEFWARASWRLVPHSW